MSDEFPDDLLLEEDAPDPLATIAIQERRPIGRRKSSLHWLLSRYEQPIRWCGALILVAGIVGLLGYAANQMLHMYDQELESQRTAPPLARRQFETTDPYIHAPKLPAGPVRLTLELKNIQFNQQDAVRTDLNLLISDRLLENGNTISDLADYELKIIYTEIAGRNVTCEATPAEGGTTQHTVPASTGHISVLARSANSSRDYPLVGRHIGAPEPVKLGQIKPFSERARRIIRSQMYAQVREFVRTLRLP